MEWNASASLMMMMTRKQSAAVGALCTYRCMFHICTELRCSTREPFCEPFCERVCPCLPHQRLNLISPLIIDGGGGGGGVDFTSFSPLLPATTMATAQDINPEARSQEDEQVATKVSTGTSKLQAIKIIDINPETKAFSLVEENVRRILLREDVRDKPVVVVSVAGSSPTHSTLAQSGTGWRDQKDDEEQHWSECLVMNVLSACRPQDPSAWARVSCSTSSSVT